ncbi:MAG: lytic transglycosylase domain-containing protein [Bdellovibrionales bacterium]|nr:lytic transglycosylase domain-containing protein [Bdellovibrionales bacterium]
MRLRRDRVQVLRSFARQFLWGVALLGLVFTHEVSDESFAAGPGNMTVAEVEAVFVKRLPAKWKPRARALAEHLHHLCERHGFDPAFVLSLIHKESSFKPNARSKVGAVGLMQFLPTTAKYVAKRNKLPYRSRQDLKDPFVNLTLGVHYLAYLRRKFETTDQALAAYNLGPTRVRVMILNGYFDPGPVRKYVDDIKAGRSSMKREGRELATVASYAAALSGPEHLWERLTLLPEAEAAPAAAPAVYRK